MTVNGIIFMMQVFGKSIHILCCILSRNRCYSNGRCVYQNPESNHSWFVMWSLSSCLQILFAARSCLHLWIRVLLFYRVCCSQMYSVHFNQIVFLVVVSVLLFVNRIIYCQLCMALKLYFRSPIIKSSQCNNSPSPLFYFPLYENCVVQSPD